MLIKIDQLINWDINPRQISKEEFDKDLLANNFDLEDLEEFKGLDFEIDKIFFNIESLGDEEITQEIDFNNINANNEREKKFRDHLVTCPECDNKFNIQL